MTSTYCGSSSEVSKRVSISVAVDAVDDAADAGLSQGAGELAREAKPFQEEKSGIVMVKLVGVF